MNRTFILQMRSQFLKEPGAPIHTPEDCFTRGVKGASSTKPLSVRCLTAYQICQLTISFPSSTLLRFMVRKYFQFTSKSSTLLFMPFFFWNRTYLMTFLCVMCISFVQVTLYIVLFPLALYPPPPAITTLLSMPLSPFSFLLNRSPPPLSPLLVPSCSAFMCNRCT